MPEAADLALSVARHLFTGSAINKKKIYFWMPGVARAHCSKGGAKVKINVFKFGSNIHSSIPNDELH